MNGRRAWLAWTFAALGLGLGGWRLMRVPELRVRWDHNCVARSVEEYQRMLVAEVHYPWEAAPDLSTALTRLRERPEMWDGTGDDIYLCDCMGQMAIHTAWEGAKGQGYAPDGRLEWAVETTDIPVYCGGKAAVLRFGPHPGGRQECTCASLTTSNLNDPAFPAAVSRGDAAALVRLLAGASPTSVWRPYLVTGWRAWMYGPWPWE